MGCLSGKKENEWVVSCFFFFFVVVVFFWGGRRRRRAYRKTSRQTILGRGQEIVKSEVNV